MVQLVSFLCGAFKKKPPSPAKQEDMKLDFTTAGGGGDAMPAPDDHTPSKSPSHEASDQQHQSPSLPPPPGGGGGGHHLRTASCTHQRSFSGAASKLASSMSMKVLGSAVGRQASRREKEKKFKPEDSIWKKTIILGEKCRVPDEEEDDILYDEKGNRISTYHHRRSHSGKISFSGRASCVERADIRASFVERADGRFSCVERDDLSKN